MIGIPEWLGAIFACEFWMSSMASQLQQLAPSTVADFLVRSSLIQLCPQRLRLQPEMRVYGLFDCFISPTLLRETERLTWKDHFPIRPYFPLTRLQIPHSRMQPFLFFTLLLQLIPQCLDL